MHQVNKSLDWQTEMRNAYRSVSALTKANLLTPEEALLLGEVEQRYSIFLTPYYASLMDLKNPKCPIRLQALPHPRENEESNELLADPLYDLKHQPAPKITHRYENRALLHLTINCSMYCRYCFRKSLLNELKSEFIEGDLSDSLKYLQEHREIEEVILSGGDPLLVTDLNLISVLEKLSNISHIKRIRLHTRVPVTLPMRVTEELILSLAKITKPLVFVLHFNHPKEITGDAIQAISLLKKVSSQVLNQSVLLKEINSDASILKELSEKLFDAGVLPYYLHHPDKARGTKHFQISQSEGLQIFEILKKSLPGYLVPRYVVDNPALPYKQTVE